MKKQTKHDDRIKEFWITAGQVQSLIAGSATPPEWNLPDDAELVYFKLNDDGSYTMRVRSDSYDPVTTKTAQPPVDLRVSA